MSAPWKGARELLHGWAQPFSVSIITWYFQPRIAVPSFELIGVRDFIRIWEELFWLGAACGFAASQCDKALPYRELSRNEWRLCLLLRRSLKE